MGLRGFFGADRVVSEATGGVFSTAEMVLDALEVYYVLPGSGMALEAARGSKGLSDSTRCYKRGLRGYQCGIGGYKRRL